MRTLEVEWQDTFERAISDKLAFWTVLSEGKIIYSGPVEDVVAHFQSLGYELPDRMDVADWLQTLPTKDGSQFLKDSEEEDLGLSKSKRHLSTDEFSTKFYESEQGRKILDHLKSPLNEKDSQFVRDLTKDKYKNTSWDSMKLVVRRELVLWWRDKYQIKAKIMQALAVGVIDGTLFWQSTSPTSIVGLLFQAMFVQVIGASKYSKRQLNHSNALLDRYSTSLPFHCSAIDCETVSTTLDFLQTARCELLPNMELCDWSFDLQHTNFIDRLLLVWNHHLLVCRPGIRGRGYYW